MQQAPPSGGLKQIEYYKLTVAEGREAGELKLISNHYEDAINHH